MDICLPNQAIREGIKGDEQHCLSHRDENAPVQRQVNQRIEQRIGPVVELVDEDLGKL